MPTAILPHSMRGSGARRRRASSKEPLHQAVLRGRLEALHVDLGNGRVKIRHDGDVGA